MWPTAKIIWMYAQEMNYKVKLTDTYAFLGIPRRAAHTALGIMGQRILIFLPLDTYFNFKLQILYLHFSHKI